jgi:hypothetical protein
VLAAVQQNGWAAVQQNGWALQYAAESTLKADKDIVLTEVGRGRCAFIQLPTSLTQKT